MKYQGTGVLGNDVEILCTMSGGDVKLWQQKVCLRWRLLAWRWRILRWLKREPTPVVNIGRTKVSDTVGHFGEGVIHRLPMPGSEDEDA